MNIYAHFDGGNIEVLNIEGQRADVRIRADQAAAYCQWFYFSVEAPTLAPQRFNILNAHATSYPEGWPSYCVLVSHDRQQWQRVPTQYDGQSLTIDYTPQQRVTFYAYFVPYSYERYLDCIARVQAHCAIETVATSCEGRPLHVLTLGEASDTKPKLWFIARQHAGETMASWFIEGLLDKLLDPANPYARKLLNEAVIYIVPHMNPDGGVRGHLRANAKGMDLNRQWHNPCPTQAPEVFGVRQKMARVGVDFFMDVHGDETIPHVFLADAKDNPTCTERQRRLTDAFTAELQRVTPDFQTQYGYEKGQFSEQQLTLACNQAAHAFNAVSFTLEMPFKDHDDLPEPREGWSPKRSKALAEAVLQAMTAFVPQLR